MADAALAESDHTKCRSAINTFAKFSACKIGIRWVELLRTTFLKHSDMGRGGREDRSSFVFQVLCVVYAQDIGTQTDKPTKLK